MKFKNIAMLIMMFTLAGIFGINSVSASASEDVAIETEQTNDKSVEETVTEEESVMTLRSVSNASSKEKITKDKIEKKYTDNELRLMASIINCEAGGEPYQGKLAVGIVVMNRVSSKSFPNSIKKVIYQKGQFSPVRNGSLKKRLSQYDSGKTKSKQWKSCISAAKKVLNGQRTIIYKGKEKNMKGFYFFSVRLKGARFRLGGHRFK